MATLKSRSRTAQTYNLPHEFHCSDGECRCADVQQHSTDHDKDTGIVSVAVKVSKLAASVIFLAGETKSDLPDTILQCPDIQGALSRRELVEVKE
jgi:hypothetical protein